MEDIFNSWIVNQYIAHRGLHNNEIPENSLAAFQNAIDHDYGIELDIHPLEDFTPVVFHDETLKRMTGEDGYIKQVKNVEELKKFKLLKSEEKIPTLEEALSLINDQVRILIEIKDYNMTGTFEKAIYEVLKDYKGEYAVMSFNPYSVKWFKINAPEVVRGLLSCYFKGEKLNSALKFALKRMLLKKVADPQFIAYKWNELPNKHVNKVKHLPLLAWPVPSQQEYMKVAKHCDNIIFEYFEPKI
jgi:glycerophosphoryl diester phosphodiesterase